jgi:hypothetical protein
MSLATLYPTHFVSPDPNTEVISLKIEDIYFSAHRNQTIMCAYAHRQGLSVDNFVFCKDGNVLDPKMNLTSFAENDLLIYQPCW